MEGAQPSLALIIVLSLFLPLTPIGPEDDDDVYFRLQNGKGFYNLVYTSYVKQVNPASKA
jgi:hypothetical protein